MFWNFGKQRNIIATTNLNDMYVSTINEVKIALGGKATDLFRKRHTKRIFVIDFDGDVMASQSKALTYEVTSVICNANPSQGDSVLIRLSSPGGAAHAYGYAASQLHRLKKAGIPTVVAVDKVAASGGYMMAVVADKIISAPFAIIGSIGVVAEFPNVHDLLQNLGIHYKQYTAGKFKRTVSAMGEITEEGEKKFKEDLSEMYDLFKNHVAEHRPELDIDLVATGEHWQAVTAIKLGLVDEIKTSEEFILENLNNAELIQIQYVGDRKTWAEKLGNNLMLSFWNTLTQSFWKVMLEFSVNQQFPKI